jgi:hypothetical protein
MMISQIAPTLHDEIIEFEARISKYRVGANPICLEIVNKITSIVQVLFPKLTVSPEGLKLYRSQCMVPIKPDYGCLGLT